MSSNFSLFYKWMIKVLPSYCSRKRIRTPAFFKNLLFIDFKYFLIFKLLFKLCNLFNLLEFIYCLSWYQIKKPLILLFNPLTIFHPRLCLSLKHEIYSIKNNNKGIRTYFIYFRSNYYTQR